MGVTGKVEYLVVDTSAFIKNVPLQDVGDNIITEPSVISEITNKRQLKRLVVLPYDLSVKEVFPENIKFVTEFSKKTGDYTSLSATDIKVIALTYQLEKEHLGTSHLKQAPQIVKTLPSNSCEALAHPKSIAGFYLPVKDDDEESDCSEDVTVNKNNESEKNEVQTCLKDQTADEAGKEDKNGEKVESVLSVNDTCTDEDEESDEQSSVYSDSEQKQENESVDLAVKFERLNCDANDLKLEGDNNDVNDILEPIDNDFGTCSTEEYSNEEDDDDDDDDDDEGWITPSNVALAKKRMDSDVVSEKPAKVACMTTDFAMQNVLMQIGLNVAALDGRVIKQMRTFIFRCYACFKTTSIMTKVFCPKCGLKTLKKVAVSLDDQGNETIHINFRRPLSSRGKRFSLPTPKGGKHAINPILVEDQPMPDQRPSRLAKMKNDPLNDDYIAGYSPFVMRDVNSRSAMLGIRQDHREFKYWMKKNPNESRKKRK